MSLEILVWCRLLRPRLLQVRIPWTSVPVYPREPRLSRTIAGAKMYLHEGKQSSYLERGIRARLRFYGA